MSAERATRKPGAGGFVHLAEAHDGAVDDRLARAADFRFLHFEPEVVAFAGSFADAGEDREAAMHGCDAGDQLGQDDGLAQAGTTEEADLTAANEGGEQVDDLDAGLELLGLGRKLLECGRIAVDRPSLRCFDVPAAVDRVAKQVEHTAECALSDRNAHRVPGVEHGHAAHEAVGGSQGHATDAVAAQVLLDLTGQFDLHALGFSVDLQGVEDVGQVPFIELGVEGRADHLGNASRRRRGGHHESLGKRLK